MIYLNNKIKDRTNIFLLVLNVLFFIYYILLSFYTRLHYDDLHFMWMLKKMSVGEFVSVMYYNNSGRFAGYFLYGIIFKIILFFNEYRFFPILFWFIGVSICWYVAKSIFKNIAPFLLLNTVLLFYNLYVLTNIDFAVFNWLCAMGFYLYAPFLILILYLLNKRQFNLFLWFVLILLAIFLGGGQEAFTPVVLVVLFLNGLYYLKQYSYKFSNAIKDIRVRKIVIAGFIMLFCFIIVIIAPGNYVRMKLPEFVTPSNITGFISGFANAIIMFLYFISFYLPYYVFLATVFLFIGLSIPKNSLKIISNYTQIVLISIFVYSVYLIFSVFPSVYLWSGFGIQRNYTHVVFFTMLFICFHSFIFGYFKANLIRLKLVVFFMNFGIVILICIMIVNLYNDTISARKYANSVDKRIELLERLNKEGVTGLVYVDPVSIPYTVDTKYMFYKLIGSKNNPQSVLYYISDTDTDTDTVKEPNEYAYHLQKVYGFNFQIKLKGDIKSTKP